MNEFDDGLSEGLRRHHPSAEFREDDIERRIEATLARGSGEATEEGKAYAVGSGRREAGGSGGAPGGIVQGPARWWRNESLRPVLAAAASLLLFVGGMEYGRRTAAAPQGIRPETAQLTPTDETTLQPASLPLSIQSTGSQYVASLARFTGEASSLPEAQREIAREVALAVLYGAALELFRGSEDDEALRAVVDLISATQAGLEVREPPVIERF